MRWCFLGGGGGCAPLPFLPGSAPSAVAISLWFWGPGGNFGVLLLGGDVQTALCPLPKSSWGGWGGMGRSRGSPPPTAPGFLPLLRPIPFSQCSPFPWSAPLLPPAAPNLPVSCSVLPVALLHPSQFRVHLSSPSQRSRFPPRTAPGPSPPALQNRAGNKAGPEGRPRPPSRGTTGNVVRKLKAALCACVAPLLPV